MTDNSPRTLLVRLRRLLGRTKRRLFPPPPLFLTEAYSQEGEDLILARIFMGKSTGFYADVGAHHPKRFSNTYLFYKQGWLGINIDAMPGSMEAFRRERPRDCNIEAAVARQSGPARKFWVFNEPALNTFDEVLAHSREGGPYNHAIIGSHEVPTRTLKEIFDAHLPAGVTIDFLSVDVEGLDLEVLQSNDWKHYRPNYVLAECMGLSLAGLPEDPVWQFLAGQGYEIFAKTVNTVIFKQTALAS